MQKADVLWDKAVLTTNESSNGIAVFKYPSLIRCDARMTACARDNSTPLQCNNGCCGTTADQKCCSGVEISETVLIISCVVGALVVFAVVILLVLCITKKKKDAVIRIQPRRRHRRQYEGEHRRRQRTVEVPKPPPYSEAPPAYNSWNEINQTTPSVPHDTEHEQTTSSRTIHARENGAPYENAVPSRSSRVRNNRSSPFPTTSESRPVTIMSNNRIHTQSDIIVETVHLDEIQRRQNRSRNRSISQIPREDESYREIARNRQMASSSQEAKGHVNKPSNHRPVVPVMTSSRPGHTRAQEYTETEMSSVDLPGEINNLPESPPPINRAAAMRSAKRREVLMKLESRRRVYTDMASSDEQ